MSQATHYSPTSSDRPMPFLTSMNFQSGSKFDNLEEIMGHFAHDIRNLLTIVSGCSELAQGQHLSADRQKCYLEAVQDGSARASALSANMLAFIRQEDTAIEPFDVVDRVQSLGRLLQLLVGSRIALALKLPPRGVFIQGSPAQFDAAVINLAANARDAISATGRLDVTVEAHPSHAEVQVEDNGAGISGRDAKRIFEPFYTTKTGRGTGLGLAQVARFVRSVDGEIGVRTCAGRGTAISLYLPTSSQTLPSKGGTDEPMTVIEGEVLRVVAGV